MVTKAPPTGKLARTSISGLALAHAGIVRLGHQARQVTRTEAEKATAQTEYETELGRILFRALNQLRGTALKLSQLLSMEAGFLPEGVRRELAKGCYQVTPLNRALVHKVFRHEFTQTPEQLFAHFDAHAFAAASLGQVHCAQLADGTQVAVKIQYPGIAACIHSDIRMLRGLLQTLSLGATVMPSEEVIAKVLHEVEHKLKEELDYQHEAQQLNWFYQQVRLAQIVIPRPITSHSSMRILTMQKLEGLHLDAWLATEPPQEDRNHYGQLLFDWFWHSVCDLQRLHADPHPGNFLMMAEGQLGILDFGCTRSLSKEFCAAMAQAWHALLKLKLGASAEQYALVHAAYRTLGLIDPDMSLGELEEQLIPVVAIFIDWQLEPYVQAHFDFRHKSAHPTPQANERKHLVKIGTAFDTDILYFDRAYLGLMHMLKKIGATVNTQNPWTTS